MNTWMAGVMHGLLRCVCLITTWRWGHWSAKWCWQIVLKWAKQVLGYVWVCVPDQSVFWSALFSSVNELSVNLREIIWILPCHEGTTGYDAATGKWSEMDVWMMFVWVSERLLEKILSMRVADVAVTEWVCVWKETWRMNTWDVIIVLPWHFIRILMSLGSSHPLDIRCTYWP